MICSFEFLSTRKIREFIDTCSALHFSSKHDIDSLCRDGDDVKKGDVVEGEKVPTQTRPVVEEESGAMSYVRALRMYYCEQE